MTNVRDTIKLERDNRQLQQFNNELHRQVNALHIDVKANLQLIELMTKRLEDGLHTEKCVCKDCRDVNDT